MTWIKICGMTNLEDGRTAVDAGADALGFVFYKKSPRNVAPDVAREIIANLPTHAQKIGVFVNGFGPDPVDVAREVGLTGIQISLSFPSAAAPEPAMLPAHADFRPLKLFLSLPMAWFLEDAEKVKQFISSLSQTHKDVSRQPSIPDDSMDTLFLDSSTLEQPGGTGKVFDWTKAAPVVEGLQQGGLNLVVAGGLTPTNVADAMRILKPWGVDVSSGVEARPGKKDPEKVRAFISAVRQADRIA